MNIASAIKRVDRHGDFDVAILRESQRELGFAVTDAATGQVIARGHGFAAHSDYVDAAVRICLQRLRGLPPLKWRAVDRAGGIAVAA